MKNFRFPSAIFGPGRLPWYFKIYHMPGKTNSATDATSSYPSPSNPETLDDELAVSAAIHIESNKLIIDPSNGDRKSVV